MLAEHSSAAPCRRGCFVVLSSQRSGSTLLCELLGSHPGVEMGRELFKLSGEGRNLDPDRYDPKRGSARDFLRGFFRAGSPAVQARGFKLMLDQLKANVGLEDVLAEEGISVVHLERSNLLKQHVSRQAARRSLLYHAEKEGCHESLFLDVSVLLEELQQLQGETEELRRLASRYGALSITYEDLVRDREEVLVTLQRFLRLEPRTGLTSPLVKILPDDLNRSLVNYPQVHSLLAGTRFSPFLDPLDEARVVDQGEGIFIHIPKVAGTSIEAALYGTFGRVGHRTAMERRQLDMEAFDRSFKFAFVRNPYDRFVSAFVYMRNGGRNRFDREWAEKNLAHYKDFDSFVLALQDPAIARLVMKWMHFRPQHEFVCDGEGNLMVDFLGRYETLEEDFRNVSERLGRPASLPRLNRVERGGLEDCYSSTTRDIVHRLYARDFDLFDYGV